MINTVEGFKNFRFNPMEKLSKGRCRKGLTFFVNDIINTFFSTPKDQLFSVAVLQTATYQELIVIVQKIIGCLLGKTIE